MTHGIAVAALLVALVAVLVAWRAMTIATARARSDAPLPPDAFPRSPVPPPMGEGPPVSTDPAVWLRIEALESRVATQEARISSMPLTSPPAGADAAPSAQAGTPPPRAKRPHAAYP